MALEGYQPLQIAAAKVVVTALSAVFLSRAEAVAAVETAPTLLGMVAPAAEDGE